MMLTVKQTTGERDDRRHHGATEVFLVHAFIAELCSMVERDPQKDTEYQSAFIGEETKARTVKIGKILLRHGGEDLMVFVHDKVLEKHGIMSARMLECSWDGIGDWLG